MTEVIQSVKIKPRAAVPAVKRIETDCCKHRIRESKRGAYLLVTGGGLSAHKEVAATERRQVLRDRLVDKKVI